jgi:ankyrin repeat protein
LDDLTALTALLRYGSDVDRTLSMVKKLLDNGVDVNAPDARGTTALMTAARTGGIDGRYGTEDLIEELLARGADIHVKKKKWRDYDEEDGYTALMYAIGAENVRLVKDFLARKADANAADSEGRTALMLALYVGRSWHREKSTLEIVEALLRAGADVNAECKAPFMVCNQSCGNEVMPDTVFGGNTVMEMARATRAALVELIESASDGSLQRKIDAEEQKAHEAATEKHLERLKKLRSNKPTLKKGPQ